ncbi:hypothetical protein SDC9_19124 [bioreactor metagenome]|uniref:AAA-ATPase-like domain-containing protein n=1 Tax=bioreactor metagenome TaxID=1076179 RepID=A0A644U241_9ZZZZ
MNTITDIEKYLFDFFSNRFEEINSMFYSTRRSRVYDIYPLKEGTEIMDFINSIHGNIEERFYFEKLVPHKFATPENLIKSLNAFKKYLCENKKLIENNLNESNNCNPICYWYELLNELIDLIDHINKMYESSNTSIPYEDLRYYLIVGDVDGFIKLLKSLLASLPYSINKISEGYYHSNVHIILKLLGFDINSEETTNIGRIDATIRFYDYIYIFEFKFDVKKDNSKEALQQIIEKKYSEKFEIDKKKIIAIGVSFSSEERNINGYKIKLIKN